MHHSGLSHSPSSCHCSFVLILHRTAQRAPRALCHERARAVPPDAPSAFKMLGVPAGGSGRRKKGLMYSMGNVCVFSSPNHLHLNSEILCQLSFIVLARKRSSSFVGDGVPVSARARCSAASGCGTQPAFDKAVREAGPDNASSISKPRQPDR